jgi:hypothetical protein
MALKFWNIGKANAEITQADEAVNPALEKAGIKTLLVDGKTVAYADAPLAHRITALIAANPRGADLQEASELLASNDAISKALDKSTTDLAVAQTSVATLTRENAELASNLATSQSSVQSLTAEKADLNNRLQAAVNQFTANEKELKVRDAELSKLCVAAGCLDLKGEDGQPLAADATEEIKLAAASRIAHGDKLKAYRGAVNAAIAKTGALPLEMPVVPPGSKQKAEPTGRARMLASMKIDGLSLRN